jgi:hypothetical protein
MLPTGQYITREEIDKAADPRAAAHCKRAYRMGRRDGILFMLRWFFKLQNIDFDKLIQEEENEAEKNH